MRLDLIQQVINETFGAPPELTLRNVERSLEEVFRNDPLKGARAIGHMYGHAFKRKEALRDGKRVCVECHTIAPHETTTCLSCGEPLRALGPHDRPECPCGHPPYEAGPCAGCNCADGAP